MILDTRTLSCVNVIVAVVLCIIMLFVWKTRKTYPGIHLWTMGYFSAVIGFSLLSLRGLIPDLFTVVVANIFIYFYYILLFGGIQRFWEHINKRWEYLVYLTPLILVSLYFTYMDINVSLRISIISLLIAIICLRCAVALFWNIPNEMRSVSWFGGSLFLIYSLSMCIRAALTYFWPTLHDFFEPSLVQSLAFLIGPAISIAWSIALISLHSKRLELDLISTQKEMQRMAMTDGLTRVYNHRFFYEIGKTEVLQAHRYQRPIAVLIFDVDHFKQVNDTYGHLVGDKVLVNVVAICQKYLRSADIFSRLGGDEFGIILPQTDLDGSKVVAERLRVAIAETDFLNGNEVIKVTISVGVSVVSTEEVDIEAGVKRADMALYEIKRGRRNQVAAKDLPEVKDGITGGID